MQFRVSRLLAAAASACALLGAGGAHASLTTFQTFVGNYGVSSDGWGDTTSGGTISAFVPAGATVKAAYLYTTTSNGGGNASVFTSTLNGSLVNFTDLGTNPTACCQLAAGRADVTSIVKPVIDGGVGGTYDFRITESNTGSMDGEALVVVYELASLGVSTIGILDGSASSAGDTAHLNFASGIDKTVAGFAAEMRLGIGFSYNGSSPSQVSKVNVNGKLLTDVAGNYDDGQAANGALITVGGDDDPLNGPLPTLANDHERYNLASLINQGDTTITVDTINSSFDDNIFLALFKVTGEGTVCTTNCTVPEPMSLALVGAALVGLGAQRRRAARKA